MTALQKAIRAESERMAVGCRVVVFINSLSESDRKVFEDALMDSTFTHTSLSRVVRTVRPNDPLSREVIRRHRIGECSCQT